MWEKALRLVLQQWQAMRLCKEAEKLHSNEEMMLHHRLPIHISQTQINSLVQAKLAKMSGGKLKILGLDPEARTKTSGVARAVKVVAMLVAETEGDLAGPTFSEMENNN